MMMRYLAVVATVLISGSAFSLTEKDREIADEFLDMPTAIQFIEADSGLMKLSPEEMYDRLDKDGVISGIKEMRATEQFIKNHPDLDLFEAGQKKKVQKLSGDDRK